VFRSILARPSVRHRPDGVTTDVGDVRQCSQRSVPRVTPHQGRGTGRTGCVFPRLGAFAVCANVDTHLGERGPVAAPRTGTLLRARTPPASDVRSFRAWLKAGRVIGRGQTRNRIVAPVMGNRHGTLKVATIMPASVFDVTETGELARCAVAERSALWAQHWLGSLTAG
jgi:hypothetical protein